MTLEPKGESMWAGCAGVMGDVDFSGCRCADRLGLLRLLGKSLRRSSGE